MYREILPKVKVVTELTMVALFVNIDERGKRKSLQRSYYNEAIAK